MTVEEVCELLRAKRLGEYIPIFEAEEVSHFFFYYDSLLVVPISPIPLPTGRCDACCLTPLLLRQLACFGNTAKICLPNPCADQRLAVRQARPIHSH